MISQNIYSQGLFDCKRFPCSACKNLRKQKRYRRSHRILLLTQKEQDVWEVLAKPGRKAQPGTWFVFGEGLLEAQVLEIFGRWKEIGSFSLSGEFLCFVRANRSNAAASLHYRGIRKSGRYQTVYSKELGSAAAPTAGLHFTPELMKKLEEKGVRFGYVTLHVRLGTFRPCQCRKVEEHIMHSEHYEMPKETADLILETKAKGGRVIAVGTTSCRTLESVAKRRLYQRK